MLFFAGLPECREFKFSLLKTVNPAMRIYNCEGEGGIVRRMTDGTRLSKVSRSVR